MLNLPGLPDHSQETGLSITGLFPESYPLDPGQLHHLHASWTSISYFYTFYHGPGVIQVMVMAAGATYSGSDFLIISN